MKLKIFFTMSNPLIRSIDHFVLLEPNKKEEIVSKEEAIIWLKNWLLRVDVSTIYQTQEFKDEKDIAAFLENTCELEIEPGYKVKWFAVRLSQD